MTTMTARRETTEPERIGESLGDILQRLSAYVIPDREGPPCRELLSGEIECHGGVHYLDRRTVTRRCPEAVRAQVRERIPVEAERLAGLLRKAGYQRLGPTDRRDIGQVLRAGLEPRPEITGCDRMLRMLDECARKPLVRNVILQGERGLGKTTAQLCLYFSQLAIGVPSKFLQSSDLRSVAARRQSADPDAASEADAQLKQWQAARVLVWSDLGDNDCASCRRAPCSHSPRDRNFSATVQDLLENFGGVLLGSTNLNREKLEGSHNFGPRATDRIFADHNGRSAIVIELTGPSQRVRR